MVNKMSFLLILNIFSDFSSERDRRMDGRMDRACFRGADRLTADPLQLTHKQTIPTAKF